MSIDKLHHLVFVGLNGRAAALDRDTGEIVWHSNEMRGGYVTLLLDGDRLIVSTNGFIYCLDPYTGKIRWQNEMIGFGYGPTSIVSVRGQSNQAPMVQAAAEADAATAAATVAAS